MKYIFFLRFRFVILFSIFFSSRLFANTYYWVGGNTVSSVWGATGNWALVLGGSAIGLISPTSADVFIFDGSNIGSGSGSVTFTLADSPIIGQLEVRNFQQPNFVLFKPNTAGTRTISLNPNAPSTNFILVDSISTFTLSGNSSRSINLTIGTNANAIVKGVLQTQFGQTGSGRGRLVSTLDHLIFNSSASYIHYQNGGDLPIATWQDGSHCYIRGVTTTSPTNIAGQSFSNFIWNCLNQNSSASLSLSTTSSMSIRDTLGVISTGSDTLFIQNNAQTFSGQFGHLRLDGGKLVCHKASNALHSTFIINGNVELNGGLLIFDASKSTSNCSITIEGDLVQTNALIDFAAVSTFANVTMNINGDFEQFGSGSIQKTKGSAACKLVFGGESSKCLLALNGLKSVFSILVSKTTITDSLVFLSDFQANTSDFTITKGLVYFPKDKTLNASLYSVSIGSDAVLELNGKHYLTLSGNWNNVGKFLPSRSNVIFSGESDQLITNSNTGQFFDLSFQGKGIKKLALGTDIQLKPSGTLTLDAEVTLNLASQTFVLQSDSGDGFMDNTARIALMPESAKLLNDQHVRVERFVPSGKRTLRFFASPVTGAKVSDWAASFFVTGQKSNYPDNALLPAKVPTVTYYQENLNGNSSQKFVEVNGLATELIPSRGYRAFVRGGRDIDLADPSGVPFATATTISVEGKPNVGDYVANLSYTDYSQPDDDGWNLVGNPYPSAIDWLNIEESDLMNVPKIFYIFDPRLGKNGGYYTYSDGVVTPFREKASIIPSSQSFFVKLKSAGSGAIHFRETHKTGANHQANFRIAQANLLRIKVSDATDSDETVIQFQESSTEEIDSDLDAFKFDKAGISVFTQASTGQNLSINRLPNVDSVVIPLCIKGSLSGKYSLFFKSTFAENHVLYLNDHYNETSTEIREGLQYDYSVNQSAESSSLKRFSISKHPSVLTNLSQESDDLTFRAFPNPLKTNKLYFINIDQSKEEIQFELMNLNGQTVLNQKTAISSTISIPLEINNGVYILKCALGERAYFQQLIIAR